MFELNLGSKLFKTVSSLQLTRIQNLEITDKHTENSEYQVQEEHPYFDPKYRSLQIFGNGSILVMTPNPGRTM